MKASSRYETFWLEIVSDILCIHFVRQFHELYDEMFTLKFSFD